MSITGSSAPSSTVPTFLGQEAREADSLLAARRAVERVNALITS